MNIVSYANPLSQRFHCWDKFRKELTVKQKAITVLITALAAIFLFIPGVVAFRLMVEKFSFKPIDLKSEPLTPVTTTAIKVEESAKEVKFFSIDFPLQEVETVEPIDLKEHIPLEVIYAKDEPLCIENNNNIVEPNDSLPAEDAEPFVPAEETQASSDDESLLGSFFNIPSSNIEDSFVEVNAPIIQDLDSLLTLETTATGKHTVGLNKVLDENYPTILYANDLSYAIAKTHTTQANKQDAVAAVKDRLIMQLNHQGWSDFSVIFGKTGKFNIDDDAACVILVHKQKNLVQVVFHGSRSGSKLNIMNPSGDWGANWDSKLINAKEAGLYGAPSDVEFHRGFGLNFISVQEPLLKKLEVIVSGLDNPYLFVSGHSKGGAEGVVALPAIHSYLNDRGLKIRIGALLLSAPMAFDHNGAKWINTTVGIRNILRPKVEGDPVTYGSIWGNYAHVGIPLKDSIQKVNERSAKWKGKPVGRIEGWLNYHYAGNRDGSQCFIPELVMPKEELLEAYNNWVEKNWAKGINHFDTPGFTPSPELDK